MKCPIGQVFLGAAMALAQGSIAAADVTTNIVFDNTGTYPSNVLTVDYPAGVADSFFSGPRAVYLDDVQLKLQYIGDGSQLGSLQVVLLGDVNNTPGAELATLGTVQDNPSLSSNPVNIDIMPPTVALAPNTRYWISVVSYDGSMTGLGFSTDTSGPGVTGEYYATLGGTVTTYSNSDAGGGGPFQMEVIVAATALPEPSGLILAATGLSGLSLARWFGGRRDGAGG